MLPLAVQNKNIFRLAAAQALAGANSVVFYATGAIVGNAIWLLYTSDAADDLLGGDLGGRRIIKKKKNQKHSRNQPKT